MSSVKISKIEMVEAITEHLAGEGKRMTNLKKASVVQLEELVVKYGIDINAFVVERKAEMKNQRIKDKKDKEERIARQEEASRIWREQTTKIKSLCDDVIDDKLLINKYACLMELKENAYWKENGAELLAENDKTIAYVDKQYEYYKKTLPSGAMLERVDETTINVRGVMVQHNWLNEKKTTEYHMCSAEGAIHSLNIHSVKRNLYDYGVLEGLCDIQKYYINGKADYLLAKKQKEEEDYLEMIKEIEDYVKDKYAVVLKKYRMEFTRKCSIEWEINCLEYSKKKMKNNNIPIYKWTNQ